MHEALCMALRTMTPKKQNAIHTHAPHYSSMHLHPWEASHGGEMMTAAAIASGQVQC